MFRVVYDAPLRGVPEEIACLTKLGEYMFSAGTCVGIHTSFLCSYRGSIVKVAPHIVKPYHPTHELLQVGTVKIVIESSNQDSLVNVAADTYKTLKECGITLRLLPE